MRSLVNGVLLGIVIQLAALYARLDGLSVIVGIFFLILGITFRKFFLPRPLPSRPPPSQSDAYRRYQSMMDNRRVAAMVDFAVWGGTMLVVEVIALIAFFEFGFHLPVYSG